jgi:hypothetical protein
VEKIAGDANEVTLRLSETELRIARGSLSEVTHGIRIPDSEFEERLGGDREETERLLDGLRGPQLIGPEGQTIRVSAFDLALLRNAMVEMTKGVEMEEWEYPTRLGATVAEGEQLLAEFEDVIAGVGSPAEIFVKLLDEAIDVWRPVEARHLYDSVYRIADQPPDTSEKWQFEPGSLVLCRTRDLGHGPVPTAVWSYIGKPFPKYDLIDSA